MVRPRAPLDRSRSWRLNWEPGTRCEYHATSAHWVLAELIERVSGSDYRDFVHERIADALGLRALRLGVPVAEQDDVRRPVSRRRAAERRGVGVDRARRHRDPGGGRPTTTLLRFAETDTVALGVPGAGAVATAADVARLYQSLLHNPGRVWDPDVLADATGRVRVTLDEPTVGGPALRTLGLIVAGDDGLDVRRGFGSTNSARAFGHSGVGGQLAWADPDTRPVVLLPDRRSSTPTSSARDAGGRGALQPGGWSG